MLLHTVNKSPFQHAALGSCLRLSKDGSAILLIEDGVYGALKDTKISADIENAMKTKKVYALEPDIKARGVQDRVLDGITLIDYAGFVDLAAENKAVEAWL